MTEFRSALPCFRRLETSPSTHTSPSWTSSRFFIRRSNCVTDSALGAAGWGFIENRSTPRNCRLFRNTAS